MSFIDQIPWDYESSLPYLDDTGDNRPYIVYVKTQCTLPIFTVVYATSAGQALKTIRSCLGRLAMYSDFGRIVLSVDTSSFLLRRVIDDRPDVKPYADNP